eukprot:Skav210819  [mRNA]  locus=scaffold1597:243452:251305:+ [translate_table: standard]
MGPSMTTVADYSGVLYRTVAALGKDWCMSTSTRTLQTLLACGAVQEWLTSHQRSKQFWQERFSVLRRSVLVAAFGQAEPGPEEAAAASFPEPDAAEAADAYHWAESCQASSVMYIDSGLFTVYATVMPQFGNQFHNVLAQIFEGVAKMSKTELERAKNALKSSIHMNLEMRAVMMEDMGRQMVLSGKARWKALGEVANKTGLTMADHGVAFGPGHGAGLWY